MLQMRLIDRVCREVVVTGFRFQYCASLVRCRGGGEERVTGSGLQWRKAWKVVSAKTINRRLWLTRTTRQSTVRSPKVTPQLLVYRCPVSRTGLPSR